MASLEIKNVSKKFSTAKEVTVPDISLAVRDGEFIVFVGPSGCGKSTLLRMIAGLEDVSSGDIYLDDINITGLHPSQRNIAMVFQSYALYPHMNVRENMAFALQLAKLDPKLIDERVERTAKLLEITEQLDKKPRHLSGGQRQRVAIGRAIVREPKIFLFDEPLSNLDATLRTQTRLELLLLHQRLQTTMIYVTHDQIEAMTLADRIVILSGGVIEQVGTPDNVFSHPASLFVAGFIGVPKMSFLQAKIVSVKDQAIVLSVGSGKSRTSLTLKRKVKTAHFALKKNDHLTIGVRAEDVVSPPHKKSKRTGMTESLTVKVALIENLGSDTYNHLILDTEPLTSRVDQHHYDDEKMPELKVGENCQVAFREANVHLFHKNGKNYFTK